MGQTKSFDTLTDDILLRISSYQTDTATKNFLKKYIPFLATKPSIGGWTAYPPITDTTPVYLTRHTLIFSKHPFIDLDITEGQLDILTKEKNNEVLGYGTYYITLSFDNKQKAEKAFKSFCSMYEKVSKSKKNVKKGGKQVAFYKNIETKNWTNQVEFILTQDEFYDNKYKIIFGQIIDLTLEDYYGS